MDDSYKVNQGAGELTATPQSKEPFIKINPSAIKALPVRIAQAVLGKMKKSFDKRLANHEKRLQASLKKTNEKISEMRDLDMSGFVEKKQNVSTEQKQAITDFINYVTKEDTANLEKKATKLQKQINLLVLKRQSGYEGWPHNLRKARDLPLYVIRRMGGAIKNIGSRLEMVGADKLKEPATKSAAKEPVNQTKLGNSSVENYNYRYNPNNNSRYNPDTGKYEDIADNNVKSSNPANPDNSEKGLEPNKTTETKSDSEKDIKDLLKKDFAGLGKKEEVKEASGTQTQANSTTPTSNNQELAKDSGQTSGTGTNPVNPDDNKKEPEPIKNSEPVSTPKVDTGKGLNLIESLSKTNKEQAEQIGSLTTELEGSKQENARLKEENTNIVAQNKKKVEETGKMLAEVKAVAEANKQKDQDLNAKESRVMNLVQRIANATGMTVDEVLNYGMQQEETKGSSSK